MYTGSVENEVEFIASLWASHDTKMDDGATVDVGKCPKCHKGTVKTLCTHGLVDGELRSWKFIHYCDNCGEKFNLGEIRSDIFFHKPYKMLEQLETPFGNIKVMINGKIAPFRCRIETYEDPEDTPSPAVTMHVIDIDFSDLKENDEIFCGFDNDLLEYNDGDERSILYTCENEKQILGLCAFEPYEWDLDSCCFQLEDYTSKGFVWALLLFRLVKVLRICPRRPRN